MYVIITGASKGIGKAIAIRFAQAGIDLVLCARNLKTLLQVQQELEEKHPHCHVICYSVDLSEAQQVAKFADWIKEKVADIGVLVNNAGVFIPQSLLEEGEGILEQTMQTNVYSAYHLTKALLPKLIAQQSGHIFNICSVASIQPFANCSAYTVSKYALYGFSKLLRADVKQYGIKVTSVLPGATYTNAWDGVEIDENRLMSPEDVAEAVYACYQLSDRTVVEEIILRPLLGDL